MKRLFEASLFLFGLAFGFLGQTLVQTSAFEWLIFFSLGGICFVLAILWWTSGRIWPNRTNWEFITNDSAFPEKVFKDRPKVYWKSLGRQNNKMFYELNLQKERVISAIHFDHGCGNNVPKEWSLN